MYIFLSHSSKNHPMAEELCGLLEARGHQCFLAPRDIRSGFEYAEEIMDGMERSDVMLLLLSEEANNSPHVLREIERAVSKKIRIIVYQLEKVKLSKSMEYFLMSHQWVNTSAGSGYESIIDSLEADSVRQPEHGVKKQQKSFFGNKAGRILLAVGILLICFATVAISYRIGTTGKTAETVAEPKAFLGDTIIFGTYNGEPVEWRVIKVHEDNTAVIVSGHILTMKAFDAAEGGKYNYQNGEYWTGDIRTVDAELQHLLRGNNRWGVSNIRTWLNSEKENVTYEDQAPKATAMSELVNGYDTEPGFLHGFTEEELEAIVVTSVTTGNEVSEDRVFLLSGEELVWFEEADVAKTAVPTAAAIARDKTGWYEIFSLDFGVEDYYWWLRDTDTTEGNINFYEAYIVGNSYNGGKLISRSVGLEGFGIRPAMTVDLTADSIVVKKEE